MTLTGLATALPLRRLPQGEYSLALINQRYEVVTRTV
jgi:hypothetical protein